MAGFCLYEPRVKIPPHKFIGLMLLFPGDPLLPWYLQDEILGFQLALNSIFKESSIGTPRVDLSPRCKVCL